MQRGSIAAALVLAASISGIAHAQAPKPEAGSAAADYLRDVTFLASDALRGRGNGMPELDQAADYIAAQFQRLGLKPAGEDGTFFQKFEITTGAEAGANNALQFAGRDLKIGDEFVPIAFSSSAAFEGPVVFAGFGITAADQKYDDYADIDATGKIVVVFQQDVQDIDPKSPFAATDFAPHLSFVNKAINARLHGAKAIIFIAAPSRPDDSMISTRRQSESDLGIAAAQAKRTPVIEAFAARGKDLAAVQAAIEQSRRPQSFALPELRARVAADVIRTRKTVRNVVAALPGADPALKEQWVAVGAHYDHLGLGDRNSLAPSQIGQVHHGADDNASGTAGVLELARMAANAKPGWKRSVLFMAFAGEEVGLLGSSWFVNHPTVPLAGIDGMINMDMIGRMKDDRLFVGGVGTSPGLKPALEALDKKVGLSLEFTNSGYGASDQTSFNAKKIPVLFFFSGLHTDYHKPSDTADKINAPGAIKALSLIYGAIDRLASDPAKLAYVEVQESKQSGREGGNGYGPYFGSVPDFRDDLKGVLFSDVQNGSPAAKAGLKAGDLLTNFDGKSIVTLSDYAYALRTKRPGDIVPVTVKRDGRDITAKVTLETRR